MSMDEVFQGVIIIGAVYFLGWLPVIAWGMIKERREWNAAHTAQGKTHRAQQDDRP